MTYGQLLRGVAATAPRVEPFRVREHSTHAGQGCGHLKAPASFPTGFGAATGCPDKIRQVRQRNDRQAVEESLETRRTHGAGLITGMEQTEGNGRYDPRHFTCRSTWRPYAPAGRGPARSGWVFFIQRETSQRRVRSTVRAQVGNAGVVDVLVVSGYYHTLAHCLQALDVDLPEGTATALAY